MLRIHQGAYALPGAPAAVVRAYECRALLTCVSAAPFYGLWVLHQPDPLHLTETAASGAVIHRVRPKARDAILPVVSLADALCHAALCLPELEALVMIESATSSGAVALDFLRRRLAGNRNGAARSVVDLVERGSDSPLETVARVLFRRAGIHTETQADLAGIGIVDFLLEGFLIIEIDGLAFHLEPRRYKKDRARDRRAIAEGYLLLRYHYEDVVHHPERMLAEVQQVLRGRVIRLRPVSKAGGRNDLRG